MKIGIMGGTFNPIHNGHLALATVAKESAELDEVWFMPSGLPAHKSNDELLPAKTRLEMVALAIAGIKGFVVSSFEIDRPGYTYTADTVTALNEEYPQHEFFFIVGGDSLMMFHRWVKPEVISAHVTLLATGRDGLSQELLRSKAEELKASFGTKIQLLPMEEFDISSNRIRSFCKENNVAAVKNQIPIAVYEYIVEHGLYQ